MYFKGCFSEKGMFFAESQLMHGPMMPIFKSVQTIPFTDLVQTFECNLLSDSQVIAHTNTKKTKTDAAKNNTF